MIHICISSKLRRLFMATVAIMLLSVIAAWGADSDATNPVLLIIDIQEFYFPGGAMPLVGPEAAADNAARLLADWRAAGRPVIHVGHKVAAGGAFHETVAPIDGERIVMKTEVSCFNGTGLFEDLKNAGVDQLVICGMQTHMCVEGAVRAAYDLGFDVVIAADACATRDLIYGETTVTAADVHAATLSTLQGAYAEVLETVLVLDLF